MSIRHYVLAGNVAPAVALSRLAFAQIRCSLLFSLLLALVSESHSAQYPGKPDAEAEYGTETVRYRLGEAAILIKDGISLDSAAAVLDAHDVSIYVNHLYGHVIVSFP